LVPSCSMRTDGRTDMTKLTVAFRSFAKAPKNLEDKINIKKHIFNNMKNRHLRFPPDDCWGTSPSGLLSPSVTTDERHRYDSRQPQRYHALSLFAIVPSYFSVSCIIYIFKATRNFAYMMQNVYVWKITKLRLRFSAFSCITSKTQYRVTIKETDTLNVM
jgi:hypothetical protein